VPRDDQCLRRYLAARAAGDEPAACRHHTTLMELSFDRVRGLTALYSRGILTDDEREEAVQLALIRINRRLFHTFRGSSMGEWIQAVKKLITYACQDVLRHRRRHSDQLVALELDGDGEDDATRLHPEVIEEIENQRSREEDAARDAEFYDAARDYLDWALPRLTRQRRKVLELDRQGWTAEQIQAELDMSRDTVYANRSRGLKDLVKLRKEYDHEQHRADPR
jgi:DNA-directed RNA polymerase specialized sigma24 family protein